MSLGTNRDYKTRDRSARANINVHIKRTDELISTGMDKNVASEKAFNEIMNGTLTLKIRAEIERLKKLQNK